MRFRSVFCAFAMFWAPLTTIYAAESSPISSSDPALPPHVINAAVTVLTSPQMDVAFAALPKVQQQTLASIYAQWQEGPLEPATERALDPLVALIDTLTPSDGVQVLQQRLLPTIAAWDIGSFPGEIVSNTIFFSQRLTQLDRQFGPAHARVFHELARGLANWVVTADVKNPDKLRQFLEHLAQARTHLGVTSLPQLRRMPLPELLKKGGPVMASLDSAGQVYRGQLLACLRSISATKVQLIHSTSSTMPMAVGFSVTATMCGKAHDVPLACFRRHDTWVLAPTILRMYGLEKPENPVNNPPRPSASVPRSASSPRQGSPK